MIAKKREFKKVDLRYIDARIAKQIKKTKAMLADIKDSADKAEKEALVLMEIGNASDMVNKMLEEMTMEFKVYSNCKTAGMGKTE